MQKRSHWWMRRRLITPFTVFAALTALAAGPAVTQAAPSYYQVVNRNDGLCLDVTGAYRFHAAEVGAYYCVGAGNQQWHLDPVEDESGYYRLRVMHTDMCLDVAWKSKDDGAAVVQATCVDGPNQFNQQWRLAPTSDGYFELVARHSGKCLDKSHWSVVQWRCWGPSWQQWRLR